MVNVAEMAEADAYPVWDNEVSSQKVGGSYAAP